MELWERSAILERLGSLLRAREGQVAVVAGEAGIGKTVLVTEFAAHCGARVLWGACDRLVTPRALGPLHDIGRQTGGPLADRLHAGAAQEEIFAAFLDEVTGRRLLVVVEDAHWADGATLDWLIFLGRRIGRLPVMLVVTHRDDEVGPDHPLRGALAALPSASVQRVPLPPLSAACVREQARRAGRDADTVYRLAGGNPLLVTELLKSDGRATPASVQDLILDRLRGLPAPARDLAHLVSVIPTRADPVFVEGASDLADLCVAAGVLIPSGDGVGYRHELLRGAVEDSLSPARRTLLHRRVLSTLSGAPGIDPGRLVHHALHAHDDAAVLRYGRLAGASAARQGAHREAAAHYRAAAGHADGLPDADRAELFESYAFQAYLSGFVEEGLDARRQALAVRHALKQPERAGENLRWISRLAWWAGRATEARAAAAEAVSVLEAAAPAGRVQLAMAYSNQSQLHMLAGEHAEAIAWGERARELADRLGDLETAIHARINVSTSRLQSGDLSGETELRSAHAEADAAGLVDHAIRALVNASFTWVELAEFGRAAPGIERCMEYAEAHDLDGYLQYLHGVRAGIRTATCDWAGALADAEAALSRPVGSGVAVVPALAALGRIQSARGDPGALATLDAAAREAERTGELQRLGPVAVARSEYFLWYGDAARAGDEAARVLELAITVGHAGWAGELAYRLWRAGGPGEAPSVAAAPYRLMMEGDWAGAAAEWTRRGNAYGRVQALAAGDEAAAGTALRALDELGATHAALQLRAELRRRGFTRVPRGPRRATAGNVAGLTPRQADVLWLLAEGLSNAEIAARLTLSAKTVDHHISALLAKLGVTSRGQAAALARKLGSSPHAAGAGGDLPFEP